MTPDASRRRRASVYRNAVAHARETFELSERLACSLIGVARRVVRYEPTRPDDAGLRVRLRELAGERRRFGYRRLGYLLAREGVSAEPQEAAADLPGGRVEGASPRRPQAGAGHQGADDDAASVGRSTSYRMPLRVDGASASCASSTTSRESACRWWRTRRCPAPGSRGSWTACLPVARQLR